MEEQMIKKMKEACGYEFTNKLTRMYQDIGLSEELTRDFNEVVWFSINKRFLAPGRTVS